MESKVNQEEKGSVVSSLLYWANQQNVFPKMAHKL